MNDEMRPIEMSCDEIREIAGAFVLGALEPGEDAAVRAHLASCPDAHEEIAEAGGILPVLDASVPQVEPPTSLKARIMTAAAADLAARRTVSSPAPDAVPHPLTESTTTSVVAFPADRRPTARAIGRSSTLTWAMRIAAVLVIGVLGVWNVLLQQQVSSGRDYEHHVAAVLDLAGKAGSLTAILTPTTGGGPAGLAAVGADGTMAVAMRDLDPTTGDQVYEAWMIAGDSAPVPLGAFTVGTSGIAYFQGSGVLTQPGIVLALTLEPGPGATAPSSNPVSVGKTTAG